MRLFRRRKRRAPEQATQQESHPVVSEPTFGFRVRFKLPATSRFPVTMDFERLDLASAVAGSSVWLKSMKEGVPLKAADAIALRGDGYATEDEARRDGHRWRDALQVSFARTGIGADFGERAPSSFATNYFLAQMEAQTGVRVLNDLSGVQVFPTDRDVRFISSSATGAKSPQAERLIAALELAARTGPHHSDTQTLAFDLYSGSFFQPSPDARLLMLMMALETLLTLEPRPESSREHVSKLLRATEEAGLPESERASLVGSLKWLMDESIGQAGRRLASTLGDRSYMDMTPVKFFNHCYSLRSQLAHGVVPRPDRGQVNVAAANLEVMVAHLLSGSLLHGLPD